jgi:HTH-type transcriptional regulator/antitoxin HigA
MPNMTVGTPTAKSALSRLATANSYDEEDDMAAKNLTTNEYFQLIRRFPLRPIRSEKELNQATQVIDDLIARSTRSSEAEDYLDVLSDLVEKYESEHYSIPDANPAEVLQFLIDEHKTNQRAVALATGIATSTMSEILSGRRQMNLEHMRRLAAFFKLDITAFLPNSSKVETDYVPEPASRKRAAPKRAAAKR